MLQCCASSFQKVREQKVCPSSPELALELFVQISSLTSKEENPLLISHGEYFRESPSWFDNGGFEFMLR